MKKDKRDNFTATVKNKLAKRVLYVCSNPYVLLHLEAQDMIKICQRKKEKA